MYFYVQMNYDDLHINPASKPPGLLVPYSEVVLSKNKINDDKRTGSLKVLHFCFFLLLLFV